MKNVNGAIGVLDSGVGGLTTVKEIQNILPKESIIYFGDNKNVPYGNKTQEEIISLTRNMIEFLIEKDVKVIAVACNTISTIIDYISGDYDIKIIKVIDPVVDYVKNDLKKEKVGLVATNFTVESGYYDKMLGNVKVYGEGLRNLAKMVDNGQVGKEKVIKEIKPSINKIMERGSVDTVILGCTHYPIVKNIFEEVYPNIKFINPSLKQAEAVGRYLDNNHILSKNKENKYFNIYTTGEVKQYTDIMKLMEIEKPDELLQYNE